MASLLSSTEKSTLTGILGDHFDTFKEDIVVYQKPIKLATDINVDFLYGYGPVSNPTNYSYTQVSGVFSALINRGGAPKDDAHLTGPNIQLPEDEVTIKVEQATRDYLKQAQIERVDVGAKSYNVHSTDKEVNFLTKTYYVFNLKETE
tara:strand:- start:195 stop:638 length:444 start_codon:yes stop_codon:yes gene_type:complete